MQPSRSIAPSYRPTILIVAAIGLALTGAAFATVRYFEQKHLAALFQRQAEEQIAGVRSDIYKTIDELKSINRLFLVEPDASRTQFRDFVNPILQQYAYISGLGFQRIVAGTERERFVAERRREFPDFDIREENGGKFSAAAAKAEYRVLDYVEPLERNRAIVGLDLSDYEPQLVAARRARDTGLPSATDLMRLQHLPGAPTGIVVMMAVYRDGKTVGDVEERRKKLRGYTTVAFQVDRLIANILEKSPSAESGIVSVYIAGAADESRLAYRTARGTHESLRRAEPLEWLLFDRPQDVARTFDIAGQPWHMAVSSIPVPFFANFRGGTITLVAGLALTLFAAAYVHVVTTREQRVRDIVQRHTRQLEVANQALIEDIVAQRRVQNALQLAEHADHASTRAMMIVSATSPHDIQYVNQAFERITGYMADEVVGRDGRFLLADNYAQPGLEQLRALVRSKQSGSVRLRYCRKDGTPFSCELYVAPGKSAQGENDSLVVALYDLSAAERLHEQLDLYANHDVVTGLANRNLLLDRLRLAIAYASNYGHNVWLLVLKLDNFGKINDSHGVDTGTALLKKVAERLHGRIRTTDTIARLDSNEFVMVLPERREDMSANLVQRFVDLVKAPMLVGEQEFQLQCSAGCVRFPHDGEEAESLLARAFSALQEAQGGRVVTLRPRGDSA